MLARLSYESASLPCSQYDAKGKGTCIKKLYNLGEAIVIQITYGEVNSVYIKSGHCRYCGAVYLILCGNNRSYLANIGVWIIAKAVSKLSIQNVCGFNLEESVRRRAKCSNHANKTGLFKLINCIINCLDCK